MSKSKENDCVSCADGCHHCGRDQDYVLVQCDWCGQNYVREENFVEEDWHRVRAVGKYRSGESQPNGCYMLDMCSDCYGQTIELLVEFGGLFDEFVSRISSFSKEVIGEAEHDKNVSLVKEWLDTLNNGIED